MASCGQGGRDARVAGGLVRAHRTHRAPAPHRLGPALQEEQPVPTGRVGLHRPLDVLRAAVVPLRPLGEPGHFGDLLVGQARDGAPLGGHRDPRDPTPACRRPVLDLLVRDHPPGDLHEDLVDEVVVRVDLAGHHRLPEAPRRVDGDLGPVAVLRVEGEGDARDLGEHHLLDGDAHRRAGPVPGVRRRGEPRPVAHRPLGEQARPAPAHRGQDLGRAAHPQVRVVLAGEARVRRVLPDRRRPDGHRHVLRPAPPAQVGVRPGHRVPQVVGQRGVLDEVAHRRARARRTRRVVRGVREQDPQPVRQRPARGHVGVGGDGEAGRDVQPGLRQLAQRGALAAEPRGEGGIELVEPHHVGHPRPPLVRPFGAGGQRDAGPMSTTARSWPTTKCPGEALSGAVPPLLRPVARYEVGQHEGADLGGTGDGGHLRRRRVSAEQMAEQSLLRRRPRWRQELIHPVGVDRFVHQDVCAAGELDEVLARTGVAGEHDRSGVGVEPVRQRREDRRVLDERGRDADAVVLVERHRAHPGMRIPVGVRDVPGGDGHVEPAEQARPGRATRRRTPGRCSPWRRSRPSGRSSPPCRASGSTARSPAGQGGRRTAVARPHGCRARRSAPAGPPAPARCRARR